MRAFEPQGMWISPDGSAKRVRTKGGPLFEAFHGIGEGSGWRRGGHDLSASRVDMARAYASVVWAYRCIKLRADSLAGVPLVLLDRSGESIPEHPILNLLHDVNPFTMNLGDLLRATEAAYNIWGSAYWLKVTTSLNMDRRRGEGPLAPTNGNGVNPNRVKMLLWLNPQTVEVISDPVKGITGYKQTVGSQTRTYAPEQIIAFRNFDPLDDLGGLSPLSVALNEINAELNAARFVSSFFANDARPAGLLTSDQPMQDGEIERVRTWWQKLFQGAENKWKTGIVGGGLRWQTITFPPTDLALSELRAEDRRAICASFGVPAGLAGAWESTTYATAREQKASFYEDTLLPQMEYIAEMLNWSLLRPHYPDLAARGARLAFDIDSITALRESATDKAARLGKLYEAGIITRNEVRAGLGMLLLPESEDGFKEQTSPPDPLSIPNNRNSEGEASDPVERETGSPAAAKALQADLKRWERFALRRMRLGKSIRTFKSTVIPADMWWPIASALGRARSPTEVRAIFHQAAHAEGAILKNRTEPLAESEPEALLLHSPTGSVGG